LIINDLSLSFFLSLLFFFLVIDSVTDDLIPLLTYVIIKANVTDIYCQRLFCEDFLTETERLGMAGYLLCSFQTAIDYVCELQPETLQSNAEATLPLLASLRQFDSQFGKGIDPSAIRTH
jgi:hypothetical protein